MPSEQNRQEGKVENVSQIPKALKRARGIISRAADKKKKRDAGDKDEQQGTDPLCRPQVMPYG